MRVIYGGIDLGVLETYEFDVTPIYDDTGTDYLYSKVSLTVRAMVNGTAAIGGVFPDNGPPMSYVRNQESTITNGTTPFRGYPMTPVDVTYQTVPNIGVVPANSPANTPATDAARPSRLVSVTRTPAPPVLTHQAVRMRLSIPRQQLWIFSGLGAEGAAVDAKGNSIPPGDLSQVFIRSPDENQVVDCKNGPKPKVLAVHTALGDATTLMVDFSIEAYINESDVNGVSFPGALISNRFAQTQVLDDAGWMTVITAGTAIFRTDYIYQIINGRGNLNGPDSIRPLLFMPIPQGFKRSQPQVRGLPDVTGVEYSYADVQQPVNFAAGPFARAANITALHRQVITTDMNIMDGMLNSFERVLSMWANMKIAKGDSHPERAAIPKTGDFKLPGIGGAPGQRK